MLAHAMHDGTHKINTEYRIDIHKMKHYRYEQEAFPPELRHVEVVEKSGRSLKSLSLRRRDVAPQWSKKFATT
jgi:hypothetical protein